MGCDFVSKGRPANLYMPIQQIYEFDPPFWPSLSFCGGSFVCRDTNNFILI